MNLNSEQATKILHTITADKLQGKKNLYFPHLSFHLSGHRLSTSYESAWSGPTMGTNHFCSISWLVYVYVAIKHF